MHTEFVFIFLLDLFKLSLPVRRVKQRPRVCPCLGLVHNIVMRMLSNDGLTHSHLPHLPHWTQIISASAIFVQNLGISRLLANRLPVEEAIIHQDSLF